MKNYEHSQSFDKLKKTKEDINGNLTSAQYLQTLDFFIWSSLIPIATQCPDFFLNYMAKVVARQSLKASAKYSSDDRTKLPIQLFNTLTANTQESMVNSARRLFVNRGLLFGFITLFHRRLRYYSHLCSTVSEMSDSRRRIQMYEIERSIGLKPGGNLYAALMESEHWDTKAREFKAMIVQKYTRMALNHAKNAYEDYNHEVPLDDITSIYMIVVNRAIDRCDSRLGVLTVFITNWFKSARSTVHMLAKEHRHVSYESLTEELGDAIHDTIGVTLPDLDYELQQHIAYIAHEIDPNGVIRTALGIQQYVPRQQQLILEMLAVDMS